MTKNTKKLLGLVGALAVLGGAYGTIVLINQHNEEKEAEQSKACLLYTSPSPRDCS